MRIPSRKSIAVTALAAAGLSCAWLLLLRDASHYRPQFNQVLSQALQRQVEIRGPLRFSLLPFGLSAADVRVREADGSGEFLRVGQIQVGVGRWAAMHGRWQVAQIDAQDVRLILRRNADGSASIDDLLRLPQAAGRLSWALEQVAVADVQVDVDDRAAAQFWRVSRGAFKARRDVPGQPMWWELSGGVEHPSATGSLRLRGDIDLDRKQQLLQLPNLQLAWLGQAEGARTALEVSGDFEYRQRLAGLQRAKIKFDATRGQTRLQINGELPSALWRDGRLAAPQLMLRGSLARPRHTGTLQIEWRNLAAAEQGLRADSVIRFGATQDNRELQMQLRGPLYWLTGRQRFQLAQNQLDAVLRQVGQPQNAAQLQLQGDAALDWPEQRIDARLAGVLDHAPMRLDFALDDFGAPHFKLDADIARLNLNPFLLVADSPPPAATGKPGGETPADAAPARLGVSWLEGWRADGALRVGEMQLGRLHLQQVQLGLRAGDGTLAVEPLVAQLYDGTLLGSAQLGFVDGQPQIRVRQSLTHMNVAPLFRDLVGTGRLEGVGDLKLDLQLQGGDLPALQRSVNGKVELKLKQGALRGINLGQALGLANTGRERAVQQADPEARTEFTDLQASFAVEQGVAHTEDLRLVSPLLALSGAGRIDWPGDLLDYQLLATLETSQGKIDLRGVQVPVKISGPLASPHYSADLRPLIERLAKLGSRVGK